MANFLFLSYLILLASLFPSSKSSFQYFKLVQQWPVSYCNTVKNRCPGPLPHNFTLHGLWPENYTGPSPASCTKTKFQNIQDPGMLARLRASWPDLRQPRTSAPPLWSHQWRKHGTCSENMYDQQRYFNLALDWKDKVYVLDILSRSNISPGKPYQIAQINSSIFGDTKKLPELRCNTGPHKVIQLFEVIICIDAAGSSIIDCPPSQAHAHSLCLGSPNINFP